MPTSEEQKLDGWVSVTEVLDHFIPRGLLDWYLKVGKKDANRISREALKIGSRVDELIQKDIRESSYKLKPSDPVEVRNCLTAWEMFKRDYGLEVDSCQVEVIDIGQKVIGHIDIIGWGKVVDVKCSSSIRDDYWVQTSKYAVMKNVVALPPAILRLDKNLGIYQFMTAEQAAIIPGTCVKVFDGLLESYRFYNREGEK